jgi:hypothetical protein
MMTRSMLTPISCAVSMSWETARTPRPKRVRRTNWSRATIMSTAEVTTMTWSMRMLASKNLKIVFFSRTKVPDGNRPMMVCPKRLTATSS